MHRKEAYIWDLNILEKASLPNPPMYGNFMSCFESIAFVHLPHVTCSRTVCRTSWNNRKNQCEEMIADAKQFSLCAACFLISEHLRISVAVLRSIFFLR